jgi:hypothetical protein
VLSVTVLSVIMLSITMLSVTMLSVTMLSVTMLSVFMLSVIMLSARRFAIYDRKKLQHFLSVTFDKCHSGECRGALASTFVRTSGYLRSMFCHGTTKLSIKVKPQSPSPHFQTTLRDGSIPGKSSSRHRRQRRHRRRHRPTVGRRSRHDSRRVCPED